MQLNFVVVKQTKRITTTHLKLVLLKVVWLIYFPLRYRKDTGTVREFKSQVTDLDITVTVLGWGSGGESRFQSKICNGLKIFN